MPERFPIIYRLATGFFRHVMFPLRGGTRSEGTEWVPLTGGVIFAPVHISHLDAPALAATLRTRRLRAMAKEELFKNKFFGWLIAGIGAFPVRRGEGDTEALRHCIDLLKAGEAVIIFPEGTRNNGVSLLPMNSGVAMLAKKANVPVVPVGISGTLLREGKNHGLTVVYGKAFWYDDVAMGENEKERRRAFMAALEKEILLLCVKAGTQFKTYEAGLDPQEHAYPEPEAGPQPPEQA